MSEILSTKSLSFYYSKNKILHDINLSINEGDFYCILGTNGSGKTTLLKSLSNVIAYEGQIFLNGKNIKTICKDNLSKHIAFFEQVRNIIYPYVVKDIVLFSRYPYLSGLLSNFSELDYIMTDEALKKVGLFEKRHRKITELSGGEQQRVFIAQIFAQNPDILILDEPTNSLDLKYKVDILELIKEWAVQKKKTIVMSLHELDFVYKYSTRACIIDKGVLIKTGTPKEVLYSEEINRSFGIDISKYIGY